MVAAASGCATTPRPEADVTPPARPDEVAEVCSSVADELVPWQSSDLAGYLREREGVYRECLDANGRASG